MNSALVREAGCGVAYVLEFEDVDKSVTEVRLNREEAEQLYGILTRMLEKGKPAPKPNTQHPTPDWVNGAVHFPPQQCLPWYWR